MNDFTGITFGNKHSSLFGIKIVSDGSRYSRDLLPSSQDDTVEIPGGDGSYYFGSNYESVPFDIEFATDSMTEKNFRDLKRWLASRDLQKLIFDENPYKYYLGKITGTPQFNFICFDENGKRIYKGEGSFSIICYYPYAKSVYKDLDSFGAEYTNKEQWAEASGMKENLGGYDVYNSSNSTIKLFNPGDIETDFILKFKKSGPLGQVSFSLNEFTDNHFVIDFSEMTEQEQLLTGTISINTNNQQISLITEDGIEYLFNNLLKSGYLFKIPISENDITLSIGASGLQEVEIKYNYLYY